MNQLEKQLDEVIHTVWQTMLGQDINKADLEATGDADDPLGMMACIQITGGWDGAITIECTLKLARAIAEEMFGMDPGEAADDEIQDALGEMVNVVGGNVKALLDGGANLSLPSVTSGVSYRVVMPGSEQELALGFLYEGEPVRVGLHSRQL